ncbi:hypothetical protein HDK77DRAFT_427760 [Phyllosticta capitalensis]|uniref:uncharacterized protein n=1 Tax=Phyllosticta capitalensis TaxID=121624 RepID=UPI00312FB004
MAPKRYYAAVNAVRARRAEFRREDSSESLTSDIAAELELAMAVPFTTTPASQPQPMGPPPTRSNFVAAEKEPTRRPFTSFLIAALSQIAKPGLVFYHAPVHMSGEPVYLLTPRNKQAEAEAGAIMALEANEVFAISIESEWEVVELGFRHDNRAGVPSVASPVQSSANKMVSPSRCASGHVSKRSMIKKVESMNREQDRDKAAFYYFNLAPPDRSSDDKLRSVRDKGKRRTPTGAARDQMEADMPSQSPSI